LSEGPATHILNQSFYYIIILWNILYSDQVTLNRSLLGNLYCIFRSNQIQQPANNTEGDVFKRGFRYSGKYADH